MDKQQSIFFIGIGGIGMSALARYYHRQGVAVYGYDKTESPLTNALEAEGIHVHFTTDIQQLRTDTSLAVYTPAVPSDNPLFETIKNRGIRLIKRAELLGQISKKYKCIAIAGTHGKTSITGLTAHILHQANIPILAFIGGITVNYNSNLIADDQPKWMVVEADEYDRSFLFLNPDITLVSAMASDHMDIYGSKEAMVAAYNQFIGLTAANGKVIVHQNLLDRCCGDASYGLHSGSSFFARDITIQANKYHFQLVGPEISIKTYSRIPGKHNVENALAAMAIARYAGLSATQIQQGIESYRGIKRRFEVIVENNHHVFIDDYAHHPEEITACIQAVKELYPDKKITGIFQPHLFSRTAEHDSAFAESLSALDFCILMNIYPAREKPIPGISSKQILQKITHENKILLPDTDVVPFIAKMKPEILLTLGAGDIDRQIPALKKTIT
ncbi:MAG: UDP-N-acetylmuramate--L-alanine ligase [Bacteroidia bacterium]|nr:UDP-N-acetylmuramate--L-alanine ligase [Bacteroidales bacterium]NCD41428.1 UDP-N-acetylmuramate--L-alanine ligase [Bacteroidia bacterium]